ncbi:MAG TPA: hypothetical protein VG651_14925 [Stellaceae bacterium]|nr:hypothetical protein [Stellaceae bacterium]
MIPVRDDRRHRGFVGMWGWPLSLAALSLFGLLSALLGQGGVWWLLSWIALAVPLIVILRCILRASG